MKGSSAWFQLCLDNDFHSEVFNVDHYRYTAHSILDSWTVTYFTKAQVADVKRRLSLAAKRRRRLLSLEARLALQGRELSPETRLAIGNALQGREVSPETRLAISNALRGRTSFESDSRLRDVLARE